MSKKKTGIARDVLLLTRVDKPALLRRLFEMACRYSGQILSYTKMLGQMQDAGNTTTLAHYLDLLAGAGMVCGLPKYAGDAARSRGSSPKLQVFNTALMTVTGGITPEEARSDREFRGRLLESAVGAHLANAAAAGECELFYWRDRGQEVDFVVKAGSRLTAIEVKSGRAPQAHAGTAAFAAAFKVKRTLLIGGDGVRRGASSHVRERVEAAAVALRTADRVGEPAKLRLRETRRELERGWLASEALRSQGQNALAEQTRHFVRSLPSARTEREWLVAGLWRDWSGRFRGIGSEGGQIIWQEVVDLGYGSNLK